MLSSTNPVRGQPTVDDLWKGQIMAYVQGAYPIFLLADINV